MPKTLNTVDKSRLEFKTPKSEALQLVKSMGQLLNTTFCTLCPWQRPRLPEKLLPADRWLLISYLLLLIEFQPVYDLETACQLESGPATK